MLVSTSNVFMMKSDSSVRLFLEVGNKKSGTKTALTFKEKTSRFYK